MAKSRNTTSATVPPNPEQAGQGPESPGPEQISQRAYELYLQRGGSDGRDWDDWLEAERELRRNESQPGDNDE